MADSAREGAIRLERIRDLYSASGTPIFAAAAASALIGVQAAAWAWPYGDRSGAVLWAAIVVAAEGMMAVLMSVFHRRPRADAELPAWGAARTGFEFLRGVAWALVALLAVKPGEALSLYPVLVTLVGLVASSSAGLAVHLPSLLAFASGSLFPAAAFLILSADVRGDRFVAGMFASTFVLVMLNGVRMSAIYRRLIENRLDLAQQVELERRLQVEAAEGRRAAEAAAAERIRFFGAASHDLRQPVHALGLYAALLRRDPPAADRRNLIAAVGACVDTLDQLFNAILGVVQGSHAPDDRRVEAMPLQDLLDRVLLQFAPEAQRAGLTLQGRKTDAWVRADPTAVERILTNLVANAIRYTERGGVLVAARRRRGRVELIVADSGVGLAPTDQRRVFDPFFRVSNRNEAGGERGFGLGLATVRELCLGHGYDIRLRSRLGRGSVFALTLPAAQPGVRRGERVAVETSAPSRLHVLVVEDDALVADAIQRLLDTWGMPARVCDTGEEALAILDRELGDGRWFGILDYRLQGEETGLDVADAVRARFGQALPLALLTGELDPAVFAAAKRRGIVVLQKPLRPIRLRAVLAAVAAESAA